MTAMLPLRVMVLDHWDDIALNYPDSTMVSALKGDALRAAKVIQPAEDYLVKFRGAELADGETLAQAGVVPNGALIVMARRRIPVR